MYKKLMLVIAGQNESTTNCPEKMSPYNKEVCNAPHVHTMT